MDYDRINDSDVQSEQASSTSDYLAASIDKSLISRSQITHSQHNHVVYKRRFYMLILICFQASTWNLVWNTWGPISDSAELVFKFKNKDIANFANIGNLLYCLLSIPAGWILMNLGMKKCVTFCAALACFGAGVRCISSTPKIQYWMSNLSGVSSGLAGPLLGSIPALFSSVWFPANERVFSTAIITMAQFLGLSASMVLGPQLIHYKATNGSKVHFSPKMMYHSFYNENNLLNAGNISNHTIDVQRNEIMEYMYIETGLAGFLLMLILIYFPDSPPTAPSTSATVERQPFSESIRRLSRNFQFWCLVFSYALPVGIIGTWCAVLNIHLKPFKIEQDMAGWIGFGQVTLGAISNVILSGISTMIARHMKAILLVLYAIETLLLIWVLLLMTSVIPYSLVQFQVSLVLAGAMAIAPQSLFFELACERFYPVDEGILGSILVMINCGVGFIFLLIFDIIPDDNVNWITPMFLGSMLIAIPFLALLQESYSRTALDSHDIFQKNAFEDITTDDGENEYHWDDEQLITA